MLFAAKGPGEGCESREGRLRGVRSSSESSAMLSISVKDGPEDSCRRSSNDFRGLERAAGGGRRGLDGRTGKWEGELPRALIDTPGSERVRAIGGAERACADCERR